MLALLLALLIQPQPGVAAVELDPSDPQGTNYQAIQNCLRYTGQCNVWYLPGSYRITKVIELPDGVQNVYFENTTLIPCGYMHFIFAVTAPSHPEFHDMKVDSSQACGQFKPPLWFTIQWP